MYLRKDESGPNPFRLCVGGFQVAAWIPPPLFPEPIFCLFTEQNRERHTLVFVSLYIAEKPSDAKRIGLGPRGKRIAIRRVLGHAKPR